MPSSTAASHPCSFISTQIMILFIIMISIYSSCAMIAYTIRTHIRIPLLPFSVHRIYPLVWFESGLFYLCGSFTHSLIQSPIVCLSIFRCYSPFFRLFYPNSSSSLISYLTNEWIEIWFDVRIIYFSVHSNSTYYLISLCLFVLRLLLPLRPLLLLLPSSLLVVIRVL